MSKRDYYEALGLSKTADGAEIKAAYRKLAMKFHPDRNPDDPTADEKFREINEAYDILKDDEKRAAYDRFGHRAFEQGGGGFSDGGDFGFSGFADIFDEMFGGVMGGGRRSNGPQRGADLRYNMEITLEEAFAGKTEEIKIPSAVSCDECKGSGSKDGAAPIECPTCRGAGKVRSTQGFFTIERSCPTCRGQGRVIKDPCKKCSGTGQIRKEKTLSVTIPAGVEDGSRIRLSGEGELGQRGGPAGDLYIFTSISPHRFYTRERANLFCRAPIPMTIAALGGHVEAPTIDGGTAKVTIPAGAQSGQQFRLSGKGMSILHSRSRGDLVVEIQVETPVKMNKRQQELMREFEKESAHHDASPESSGFFSRLKEKLKG